MCGNNFMSPLLIARFSVIVKQITIEDNCLIILIILNNKKNLTDLKKSPSYILIGPVVFCKLLLNGAAYDRKIGCIQFL